MDIFSLFLQYFNNIIYSSSFWNDLKLANVTPAHKKDSWNDKKNNRPISVLSNISNVFENILNQQISTHFENISSKQQAGLHPGFNALHCLSVMLEKFRKALDKGGVYVALLIDLSKAFSCIPHDLVIAKLHAYGFICYRRNFTISGNV